MPIVQMLTVRTKNELKGTHTSRCMHLRIRLFTSLQFVDKFYFCLLQKKNTELQRLGVFIGPIQIQATSCLTGGFFQHSTTHLAIVMFLLSYWLKSVDVPGASQLPSSANASYIKCYFFAPLISPR